jgi:uncharacterized protein
VIEEIPKFIVDGGLFNLCKIMRTLGFDTLDGGNLRLSEKITHAIEEKRIWIMKPEGKLFLQYGVRYFLLEKETTPDQLRELNGAYRLDDSVNLFTRCLKCNWLFEPVAAAEIIGRIPEKIVKTRAQFYRCSKCQRIYWHGSHVLRMQEKLRSWGWNLNPST